MSGQMNDVTPAMRKEYADKLVRILCQLSNPPNDPRIVSVASNFEGHVYNQSTSEAMYVSKMNSKIEEILPSPQRKAERVSPLPFYFDASQGSIQPQHVQQVMHQPTMVPPSVAQPAQQESSVYDLQHDGAGPRVHKIQAPAQQFQVPLQPQHDFSKIYYSSQYDPNQYISPQPQQRGAPPFQQLDDPSSTYPPQPPTADPATPQPKQKQKTPRKKQQIQQQPCRLVHRGNPQGVLHQNQIIYPQQAYEFPDPPPQPKIEEPHHQQMSHKPHASPQPISSDRSLLHQHIIQMRRMLSSAEQAIEVLLQYNALTYAKFTLQLKLLLKKQLDSPQPLSPDFYPVVFNNVSEKLSALLKYCENLKAGPVQLQPHQKLPSPQQPQKLDKGMQQPGKQPVLNVQQQPRPYGINHLHHQISPQQHPAPPQQPSPQQPSVQQVPQGQMYKVGALPYQYHQRQKQFTSPKKSTKRPSPQQHVIDRDQMQTVQFLQKQHLQQIEQQQLHQQQLHQLQKQQLQKQLSPLPHEDFAVVQNPRCKPVTQQKVQSDLPQSSSSALSARDWQQQQQIAALQRQQLLLMKQKQQQQQKQQDMQQPQNIYPQVYFKHRVQPLHQYPQPAAPLQPQDLQPQKDQHNTQYMQIPQKMSPQAKSPAPQPSMQQRQQPRQPDQHHMLRVPDQQYQQCLQMAAPQKRPLPDQQQQLRPPHHAFLQQDFSQHILRPLHRQSVEMSPHQLAQSSPAQMSAFRSSPSSQPNKSARASPFVQPSGFAQPAIVQQQSTFVQQPTTPQQSYTAQQSNIKQSPEPVRQQMQPLPPSLNAVFLEESIQQSAAASSPQNSQRSLDWIGDSLGCFDCDLEQKSWSPSAARTFHDADDIALNNPTAAHDYEQLCF